MNDKIDESRRHLVVGGASLTVGSILSTSLAQAANTQRPAASSGINYRQPIPAQGYAFYDYSGKLSPLDFKRRAVGDFDVAIEIRYCGICHSDIHTGLGHWGRQQLMPQVTGHEIAGVVTAVGHKVTRYKVGDRVGVGCMVNSCSHCAECKDGNEQYCETPGGTVFTYGNPTSETQNPGGFTQGGYSNRIIVEENFVVKIPDAMPLEAAGPIMCSAVTVYSPLRHWKVGQGSRIAVVGMGGLGHIAVQIAKAMRADVTVFTTSPDKVEDAKRFGASEVVVNYAPEQMKKLGKKFDFILATVPYQFDMNPLISTLKRDATLCLVGVGKHEEPNQLAPLTTILGRNSFAGSLIGSIKETQDIIDFCAAKCIQPQITLVLPNEISDRWQDVIAKKARYRYVIDMQGVA